MDSEILCIIISENDSIFNLGELYRFATQNYDRVKFTIYIYNSEISEKLKPIVDMVSRFHKVLNFVITSDQKVLSATDYQCVFFLDHIDYLRICDNKHIISKFKNIFCIGVSKIEKNENKEELDYTFIKKKSVISDVKSYDESLLKYNGNSPINIKVHIWGKPTVITWLPLLERTYNKNIVNNDKVYLIQQYFIHDNPIRKKEIDYCLDQNIANHNIDKIYLLNEEIYDLEILHHSKIVQKNIDKRIEFSDILLFAKEKLDGYIIFSNSDMFFDETINNIKYGSLSTLRSLDTICRFEYKQGLKLDACELREPPRFHSQDAWIVHSKFLKQLSNQTIIEKFGFKLGVPACDHKILAEFNSLDYNIYNNPQYIRGYHYHESEIRNYTPTEMLPLPYAYSQPVLDNYTKHKSLFENTGLFWQYPVITEKTFFNQNKLDPKYLPIPWATIADKLMDKIDKIYQAIINFYDPKKEYYTCCQTIHLNRVLPLMVKCGITLIYTPHKEKGKDYINIDNKTVRIMPCPLYAVNVEDAEMNSEFINIDLVNRETKYLYSFKGAWEPHYISDIRQKIFNMDNSKEDVYIENIGKWHFLKDVYTNQQNNKGSVYNSKEKSNRTSEYNKLLLDSKFSLCPSGAGPNSIRFWESLAIGSIPVLLADTLELPFHKDWDKAILRISESDVDNIYNNLSNITGEEVIQRRINCIDIYNSFKNNFKVNS